MSSCSSASDMRSLIPTSSSCPHTHTKQRKHTAVQWSEYSQMRRNPIWTKHLCVCAWTNYSTAHISIAIDIRTGVQLHMTEAQRRQTGGEVKRESEDRAICRTKPDWPGAASGPAVTPATERGMWEKGWRRGEREERGCSSSVHGTQLLFEPHDRVRTQRRSTDHKVNKYRAFRSCIQVEHHMRLHKRRDENMQICTRDSSFLFFIYPAQLTLPLTHTSAPQVESDPARKFPESCRLLECHKYGDMEAGHTYT